MIHAFDTLKVLVKEEGAKVIQEHIRIDDFASATDVVGKLNDFSHVKMLTNIDEVTENVERVFGDIIDSRPQREVATYAAVEVAKLTGDLTEEERDALKIIGYSGTSRIQDSKGKLVTEFVETLTAKGYLNTVDITIGENEVMSFELNEKGKAKFKELFEVEANQSSKKEIIEKYGDLQNGYFLMDAEKSDRSHVVL